MSRGQKKKTFPGEGAPQGRRWGNGEEHGDITYLLDSLCAQIYVSCPISSYFTFSTSLLPTYYPHFIDKVTEVRIL